MADLWERKVPIIAEDKSFDPNRNTGATTEQSNVAHGADPLAFLVGPVEVKHGGDHAKTHVADLAPFIDRAHSVVKSETGEIRLDYAKGLCTLNAPAAQGVTGFLKKTGSFALRDVTIHSGNDYVSVEVVSMDGAPIRDSGKLLVQVGTIARPTGWKTEPARFKSPDGKQTFEGYRIVSTGTPPWQIVNTDVSLSIANGKVTKATLLDTAGFPASTVPITRGTTGRLVLRLPPNAMYVVLD